MQRPVWLALILLTATLTGCLGGSDGTGTTADGSSAGPSGPDGDPEAPRTMTVPLRYPGAEPVFGVEWANGTFHISQSNQLLFPAHATGQEPDHRVELDIADRVPAGVPTFVAVEINAEVGQGDVDIWLESAEGSTWSSEFDTPFGGYSRIEHILVNPRGSPLTVVAQLDEVPDRQEVPYTLSIDVRSNPGLALPGAPISFQAGPSDELVLESLDEDGEIDVLLFGPDDTALARLQGTDELQHVFEDGAPEGRYALMVTEGIRPVWPSIRPPPGQIHEDASLRVLSQEVLVGDPVALDQEGQATWSFEAQRMPLQAGLWIEAEGISENLQTRLAGPAGELFTVEIEGGPWLQPGFVFLTDMGDPGLVPGTYEAEVSFGQSVDPGAQARSLIVHYAR